MKVRFEEYNTGWPGTFNLIKDDLLQHLNFLTPVIEHIGSTSVAGLASKPIIDILVGLAEEDQLDNVINPLIDQGYIFYEKYNSLMPYRRLFVKLKSNPVDLIIPTVYREGDEIPNELNSHTLAHIHILRFGSHHWTRHLAYRDYLREHPGVKEAYQQLKKHLSTLEWKDGLEYNAAKNDFIKCTEEQALKWYEGLERK